MSIAAANIAFAGWTAFLFIKLIKLWISNSYLKFDKQSEGINSLGQGLKEEEEKENI